MTSKEIWEGAGIQRNFQFREQLPFRLCVVDLRASARMSISVCPQLRGRVHPALCFLGSGHYRHALTARISRHVLALGLYSPSVGPNGCLRFHGSCQSHETTCQHR
jgi:hypothetical protein